MDSKHDIWGHGVTSIELSGNFNVQVREEALKLFKRGAKRTTQVFT